MKNLKKIDDRYELNLQERNSISLDDILKLKDIKNKLEIISNNEYLRFYLRKLGFKIKSDKLDNENSFYFKYVAIGGSAGSLKKIKDIIKYIPKSNLTFFIIIHQKDSSDSKNLINLLKKYNKYYDVVLVDKKYKIEPSTIYVASAKYHLKTDGEYVCANDGERVNLSKPSISVSFESLSTHFQQELLVILSCGYGNDGSDALKIVKNNNGYVIIEQIIDCEATPMIENGINSGYFNTILSSQDIAKFLYNTIVFEYAIKKNLDSFLQKIKQVYNIDFSLYDKKHINRRVLLYFKKNRYIDFQYFEKDILKNKKNFEKLFLKLSINTTTFFRDTKPFRRLIDILKNNNKNVKIWSAGCSSGEEIYSIAIILQKLDMIDNAVLYATDFNSVKLNEAKQGIYSKDEFREYKKNYNQLFNDEFEQYFDIYDEFVVVKHYIKEKILFLKHNLISDDVLDKFDIIFCRNVLIYFSNELKNIVLELLYNSLKRDGLLIVGDSDFISNNFVLIDKESKIYKKGIG